MIANAMFYQSDDKVEQIHVMTIGPFQFALHQLWVSLASSMIILPVNLLIDQIFRRSVPKSQKIIPGIDNMKVFGNIRLRSWFNKSTEIAATKETENNTDDDKLAEVTQEMDITDIVQIPASKSKENKDNQNDIRKDKDFQEIDITEPCPVSTGPLRPNTRLADINKEIHIENESSKSNMFEFTIQNKNTRSDSIGGCKSPSLADDIVLKDAQEVTKTVIDNKRKKKKLKLPYWGAYIGWLLLFLTTAASAFFTVTYSLEWGKEKSEAWLTAMVLSIVESVVVIQPVKVCFS